MTENVSAWGRLLCRLGKHHWVVFLHPGSADLLVNLRSCRRCDRLEEL